MNKHERHKFFKEISAGNTILLEELKSKNKDFHWSQVFYPKTGDTIIHCAARYGFIKVIEYLVNEFYPSSVDCKNNDDKTALHEACQFAQHESVSVLIRLGANVNALKRADWTPLMLACTKTTSNSPEIVKNLIVSGASINFKNKDGWTALHLISRDGNIEIFDILVENGSNMAEKTKNGRTPLHIATLHNNSDLVRKLVKLKVDINERDNSGHTAIYEAVTSNNLNLVKYLIENKASVCDIDNVGFNILHLASGCGFLDIIKFLIEDCKLAVNCQNQSGLTPLHCAAQRNKKNVYEVLITYGADRLISDNCGRTPKDYFV